MERRKQDPWEKKGGWEKIGGLKPPSVPSFPKPARVSESPKLPAVTAGTGPGEDFSVGTSTPKPPAYTDVTKPAEPRTKESILKKYGVEVSPTPKSWSPSTLTTEGRKPAQPQANIFQKKLELPKQSYQRGIAYEKKKVSPYDPLPTPQGRDEKEELRMETRQRTQLAKGTSAGELARKEAVNRERTYRPTAADLDIQQELLLNDLERVEQLIGKATIAQESDPGPEQDRQLERLQQWRNSLLDQRDEIARQYYHTENREKRSALAQDPEAQARFQTIEGLREDMSKLGAVTAGYDGSAQAQQDREYLMEKYGLTERELEREAPRLVTQLQSQWDDLAAQLEQTGYDYDRMEGYDRMLADAQRYQQRQEKLRQFAQKHPYLASAVSVGMAPFQGAEFVGQALGSWGHNDTEDLRSYVPMNPYNMNVTNTVNVLRGTVAEKIEANTDWELFGQNLASFLYQTGMSIGDSALQVGTLGRAATLFMGGSAAAGQAQSVMERGGSNRQALWGGLAAGAAEMLFEYFSIDNLLKPKTVTGWKSFLKEAVKQAGVEGSEELFTEIANILSDAAIMRGKSEVNLRKTAYEAAGLSRREAEKQTFLDCVGQVAWAGAGGVVSGGVMGGVTSGVNWAGNAWQGSQGKGTDTRSGYVGQDLSEDGVSLITAQMADVLLRDNHFVDYLSRKGNLNLTKDMSPTEKQRAVQDSVAAIVKKEPGSMLTKDKLNGIIETTTQIVYDANKMNNYLLNFDHPIGKSKARFLYDVLGYKYGDGKLLYDNIRKALNGLSPVKTTETPFGIKFEYDVKLSGRGEKRIFARVIVVLQNDKGKNNYRIITLYPGKKEA